MAKYLLVSHHPETRLKKHSGDNEYKYNMNFKLFRSCARHELGILKMKRLFLLLVVIFGCGIYVTAQDIITLKNGEEIQALVQEIGDVDVKYKKIDNPNGPNYTLKKSEIFTIRYANGSRDVFVEETKPVETKDNVLNENKNELNALTQTDNSPTNHHFTLNKNSKIIIAPYALSLHTKKMCKLLERKLRELGFSYIYKKVDEKDIIGSVVIAVHPGGPSSFVFRIYDNITLNKQVFEEKYVIWTNVQGVVNNFAKDITPFIEK